ncbi:hypothetical protein GJV85_08805 [Sulfurimonas aquatica]|uniref:Uncharacterized protein n=1 Tax=Sulfurimonas aquatica TaxID=2672570 RepID=A0A975B0Z5_9BACT|nr:hypothetical protein [Sulfurimonas aquatica]QSZ42207.1 hypothetical protein GJV85_08805 [Sulfurimonas aquatica]
MKDIIEINLKKYEDAFNEFEYFKTSEVRRLNPDLIEYIDDILSENGLNNKLKIIVYIDEKYDKSQVEKIKSSLSRIYNKKEAELKKERDENLKKGIIYLIIGSTMLIASNLINKETELLKEIFLIGGWVFVWESFYSVIFESMKISNIIKKYKKRDDILDNNIDIKTEMSKDIN